MRKLLPLIFLSAAVLLSGFSFGELTSPVYENIKEQALQSFSSIFSDRVIIEKAGGMIVGQIVLEGVRIGENIQAEKVIINYNPLRYLAKRGDILPAITSIKVEQGFARVVRDAKGNINLSDIMKSGGDGVGGPQFKSKIYLSSCRADYTDMGGLPYRKIEKPFHSEISGINGVLDLTRFPKVKLYAKGAADGTQSISINGWADLKKSDHELKVTGRKMSTKKWAPYLSPYFDFEGGQADVDFTVTPARLGLEGRGTADLMSFNISGRVYPGLGLKINATNVDLDLIKKIFAESEVLDYKGRADVALQFDGPYEDLSIKADLSVKEGEFYKQKVSGRVSLSFAENVLRLKDSEITAYKGTVKASGDMDFSKPVPLFKVRAELEGLDLMDITQRIPGIEGQFSGLLGLSGSVDGFQGDIQASSDNVMLLGESLSGASARFNYAEQELKLEDVTIRAGQSQLISGSGKISRDKEVALKARMGGIRLSGEGVVGSMEAYLENFEGELSFYLNEEFFSAPLKHISAEGKARILNARLGEQIIDEGTGELALTKGKAQFKEVTLRVKESRIKLSGSMGIETETDLQISGSGLQLEDLKILNYVLPEEIRDPQGQANLDLNVYGRLQSVASLESLLALNARGGFYLKGAELAGIKVKEASLEASYKEGIFSIERSWLLTERSDLAMSLRLEGQRLNYLALRGNLEMDDFIPLTRHLGDLRGRGRLDLRIYEENGQPAVQALYSLERFRFNQIEFDRIRGGIKTKDNALILDPATSFTGKKNKFTLSGYIYLEEQFKDDFFNLKLALEEGDVQDMVDLGMALNQQLSKLVIPVESKPLEISLKGFSLPRLKGRILYSSNGVKDHFLKSWEGAVAGLKAYEASLNPPAFAEMQGKVRAEVSLFGYGDDLRGKVRGRIENASYGGYEIDLLETEFDVDSQRMDFKQIKLIKEGGAVNLLGTLDLRSQALSGKIFASDYPLDVFRLLAPRQYKGNFDLSGSIQGTLSSPSFSAELKARDLELDEVHFDGLDLLLSFSDGIVQIDKALFHEGGRSSSIEGYYSLQGDADLKLRLQGRSLVLVNFLTDQVRFMEGQAQGQLHYFSNQGRKGMQGNLSLTKGVLYVKALESYLDEVNFDLEAEGGEIDISRIFAYWAGPRTKKRLNTIQAAGRIDLNAEELTFGLTDDEYSVDFPKLYSGVLSLKNIALSGPILRPTLSGLVELRDGSVFLPSLGSSAKEERPPLFDVLFALDLKLLKSVYLSTGYIMTLETSNIFMNLEMLSEELNLRGSLQLPRLGGRVDFRKGIVSVLGRDFVLLSKKDQEQYFAYDYALLSSNYALFGGEGILPYINITAKVEVEDQELDSEGKRVRKEVQILSLIRGKVGEEKEAEAVSITFIPYIKTEAGLARASYSDQEVKLLLLPDFVKQAAGAKNGEAVDANVVLADYLNSRLQTFVFRGIERQLEETLGLDSLTLEYNFGREIRQALGGREMNGYEETYYGVGVAKGFFDRFYIDLKYRQAVDPQLEADRLSYLNYELTYKLTPIWSISYYREPAEFNDLWSGYEKITLKAGYRL